MLLYKNNIGISTFIPRGQFSISFVHVLTKDKVQPGETFSTFPPFPMIIISPFVIPCIFMIHGLESTAAAC